MNRRPTFQSKLPHVGTTIFTVMSKMANEYNAINLSQGFPDFNPPEALMNLAVKYMKAGFNQYAPMAGVPRLREALAQKNKELYNATINPVTEITVTAGASQGIYATMQAFVQPGDEVIIVEPAFDVYQPAIEINGGIVVPYRMAAPDFRIDWEAFAGLVNSKTRLILLNTPHNPTGSILRAADWQALIKLVENTNIIVLSDEVYEHLIFDGAAHCSILRYPELWKRSLVTFSFGKTFHATGWKMGYIAGAAHLMAEIRKNHQFSVFCVNHFIQQAIADFLEEKTYFANLASLFESKRNLFNELLVDSRFKLLPTYGSYFQLADYSEISGENDVDFSIRMTKEHGVAVIPVSVFYTNQQQDKLIRFCFGKTEAVLTKAGEKLCKI